MLCERSGRFVTNTVVDKTKNDIDSTIENKVETNSKSSSCSSANIDSKSDNASAKSKYESAVETLEMKRQIAQALHYENERAMCATMLDFSSGRERERTAIELRQDQLTIIRLEKELERRRAEMLLKKKQQQK
jgi:hypothetical protein